jgi:parallel beta-helix repeat protein
MSIQQAVNAANSGETINVRDGTYIENVDVNKPHLTIRSENGAKATIVQAASSDDHIFEVTADYVNIRGFTVGGASVTPSSVYLADVDYCNISNNIASNNNYGIYLYKSNSNLISNNIASNNDASGICLDTSSNSNIISNNIAS